MIQALVSKYLLPAAGIALLFCILGLFYQQDRLKTYIMENQTLASSLASSQETLNTLKTMENSSRELAELAKGHKRSLDNQRSLHTNSIEETPSNEKVDPLLFNTVKQLYQNP